jgi:hypothetical protein
MAVAAAVAICVGGAATIIHYRNSQQAREAEEAYAKNDELLDAMIDAHKGARETAPGDVALTAPLTDPKALAAEAQAKLGRPVPVADLRGSGWTIDAATICTVEKHPALRVHFTRGNQAATFLSLPSAAWADAKDGSHYELTADGYPIAGFVRSGSLNCVVGDASLGQPETTSLRDAIQRG